MNREVRWKQRFQNFERAYLLLSSDIAATIASMSEREKSGVIQHFQLLFELSWNVLKDYLEHNGVHMSIITPSAVFKAAFKAELVTQAEQWLASLQMRNKSTHIYDEKVMDEVLDFIPTEFYPLVRDLYFDLKKEI